MEKQNTGCVDIRRGCDFDKALIFPVWKRIIGNLLFTNVMKIPLCCLNFSAFFFLFLSGPHIASLRNNLLWFCWFWFFIISICPELKIYLKHFWACVPTNHNSYIFVIHETSQEPLYQLNLFWSLLCIWRRDSCYE